MRSRKAFAPSRLFPHLLRRLLRARAFSLVVVGTLALSLGALATVYAVTHAVLLAALPFAEPDRLLRIENRPEQNPDVTYEVAYPDFVDWERDASTVRLAGHVTTGEGMLVGDETTGLERVPAGIVSGNLMTVLGTKPLLGRLLQPADDHPGAAPVVALSERLWRRRWSADPEVIGQTLVVEGTRRTIVGVLPAELDFPVGARLWVPVASVLPPGLLENRKIGFFNLVARLAPGVEATEAETELRALQDRTANAARPAHDRQRGAARRRAARRRPAASPDAPRGRRRAGVARLRQHREPAGGSHDRQAPGARGPGGAR
jgi:putative ABC transport system permease protein